MYKPFGMIPALPTPMNEDKSIDYKGLEQLIDYLIDGGMTGLLVGGSTRIIRWSKQTATSPSLHKNSDLRLNQY